MVAQKGSAFVLKLGDRTSPEAFTTVGAFRTNALQINDDEVDVTHKESTGKWRELLRQAGVRSMSTSGSGVFNDDVQFNLIVDHIMGASGTYRNFQIVVPGLGTFEGAFQISGVGFDAPYNAEVTKDVTLASAGVITFTSS